MEVKEKLIKAANDYSDKILNEFLKTSEEDYKVNVYISGSVSYGYCDSMSDIEMEFYLPDKTAKSVKKKLQEIIDNNHELEGIRMGAGVSEWPLEKIVQGDIKEFWKKFNPYQMYELINALPIKEDLPLIEEVKNKISFYPHDLAQRIIKGLWLTINDSGSPYNADWSYKRNHLLPSNIFYFRSMEAILRLAYLLNNQYYPHTKWLENGLAELENDFGLQDLAKNIEKTILEEKLNAQLEIIKKLGIFMSDNSVLSKELIDHPWRVLNEKYYTFNTF